MKYYFILFLLIFVPFYTFSGCFYIKETDRIVSSVLKDLEKKEKIYLFGYGGAFRDDVEEINLSFSTKKNVDIQKARRLIIYIAETLLKKINSNTQIRPYLHNYPFTNNNLKVSIHFNDKNDKAVLPPYLAYVGLMFGEIDYSLQNLQNNLKLDGIHQETYEEALKIYRSEISSNENQNP